MITTPNTHPELWEKAEQATPHTSEAVIREFLQELIPLPAIDRNRIIMRLAESLKIRAGTINSLYRMVVGEFRTAALMKTPGLVRPLSTDKVYPWGIALDDTIVCKFLTKDTAMAAATCAPFMELLLAEAWQ